MGYPPHAIFIGIPDGKRRRGVIISSHACIEVCESGDTHMDYGDTLCIPRHSITSVDVLDISEEEIENLVNENILHTPESIEGRVEVTFWMRKNTIALNLENKKEIPHG